MNHGTHAVGLFEKSDMCDETELNVAVCIDSHEMVETVETGLGIFQSFTGGLGVSSKVSRGTWELLLLVTEGYSIGRISNGAQAFHRQAQRAAKTQHIKTPRR